jgi:hypothetical protein
MKLDNKSEERCNAKIDYCNCITTRLFKVSINKRNSKSTKWVSSLYQAVYTK